MFKGHVTPPSMDPIPTYELITIRFRFRFLHNRNLHFHDSFFLYNYNFYIDMNESSNETILNAK